MALKLYIDLDNENRLIQSATNRFTVSNLALKAKSTQSIEWRFIRAGTPQNIGVSPSFRFAAKEQGKRDVNPILQTLNAGFSVTSTADDYYVTMSLDTTVAAVDDLFNIDGNPANDVLSAILDAELLWTVGTVVSRSGDFTITLSNPVISDADLPPSPTTPGYPDPSEILVDADIGVTVAAQSHTHTTSQISGYVAGLTSTQLAALTTTQLPNFASASHTHTTSEISGYVAGLTTTQLAALTTTQCPNFASSIDVLKIKEPVLNAVVSTTYTLALTDEYKYVTLSNASAITVTIPTNASVPFPIGTQIWFAQGAAGGITFSAAGGVTMNKAGTQVATTGIWQKAHLRKIATDSWHLTF